MDSKDTIKALGNITDSGFFERLATSVLRASNPLYEALIHTGINSSGQTIKGPIDGISFIKGAEPTHMISKQHTIGDRDNLRKKWLHDPSSVKSRKKNSKKEGPGDVLKTIGIYQAEKKRTADLVGTLILTTTSDPGEDLVRDVEAKVRGSGIIIDWWPASRIAHFLDTNPDGQYLRAQFLGIMQERLSERCLHDLSKRNLENSAIIWNPKTWVNREFDRKLQTISRFGITIVIGESGMGKSVACLKLLQRHIAQGGNGLIISGENLLASTSLSDAIGNCLNQLNPNLEKGSGSKALSFGSKEKPFIVVCENIDRFDNAPRLMEKILTWQKLSFKDSSELACQIFCPVWPITFNLISEEYKKEYADFIAEISTFSEKEGIEAVLKRCNFESKIMTEFEAENIASALGNDPLLIALNDFNQKPNPDLVIEKFIGNEFNHLSHEIKDYAVSEYFEGSLTLFIKMCASRNMNPSLSEIAKLGLTDDQMKMIKNVAFHGKIFKFQENLFSQTLIFRHDRVFEWFAIKAIEKGLAEGQLANDFLSEPYFSKFLGLALNIKTFDDRMIARIKEHNPLALFYSFQDLSQKGKAIPDCLLSNIFSWLENPKNHGNNKISLRHACLDCLSNTDSQYVLKILKLFNERSWSYYIAGLRNGDIENGVRLCMMINPGVNYKFYEKLINATLIKYSKKFASELDILLNQNHEDLSFRSGILTLAGYTKDENLFSSLKKSWEKERREDRISLLDSYFWACAHCCGNSPEELVAPIIEEWAKLPSQTDDRKLSLTKENFAAYELRWAFQKYPPIKALPYLVNQTNRPDIGWEITYLLHGIDQPIVVEHLASFMAKRQSNGFSIIDHSFLTEWEHFHRQGRSMSEESKQSLFAIWSNKESPLVLRKKAFKLWAVTHLDSDLQTLRQFSKDEHLQDFILKQRILRLDPQALPEFKTKLLKDQNGEWWQLARHYWHESLIRVLDEKLIELKNETSSQQDGGNNLDWIFSELVMRFHPSVAEEILTKHWDNLKKSVFFIQTALFTATPRLLKLAGSIINESSQKEVFFKHLGIHFGFKIEGHPGITRIAQLEALLPYLDLISAFDISMLIDVCNAFGWSEFRKAHFDSILLTKINEVNSSKTENQHDQLDRFCEKKRLSAFSYWVNDQLKTGLNNEEILDIIFNWVKSKEKITDPIIEVALAVVIEIGTRKDFEILKEICELMKFQSCNSFENALFRLKRKKLK